ncbi:MAG: NosD domain-containing protein [bacterium]|nr:NosD domain-containing protein [bacterium]
MFCASSITLQAKPEQNIWFSLSIDSYVHNITRNVWYNTITEALTAASNNNVINVYPHTFYENVTISGKTNLVLQAVSFTNQGVNTNTIIASSAASPVVGFSLARRCRVIGFTIKGGPDSGVLLDNGSRSNIVAYNNIYSNQNYGIFVNNEDADGNSMISNRIHLNYTGNPLYAGIRLNDGDNSVVRGNVIYRGNESGILLNDNTGGNLICKNSIFSNTLCGIRVNGAAVLNNTILSNDCYANVTGISLDLQGDCQTVAGNRLRQNTSAGIGLQTKNNRIQDNFVCSNGSYGLYFMAAGGIGNTNVNNTIWANPTGIYLDQADDNRFEANKAYLNGYGLYCDRSSFAVITNNNFYRNTNSGLVLIHSTGAGETRFNAVKDNLVYSNRNYGLFLTNGNLHDNVLVNNRIFNNTLSGICVSLSTNNRILNNPFISGSSNGIRIRTGSRNTVVSNNYITRNQKYGILADEGTGLKVNLNTITTNPVGILYSDVSGIGADFTANNIYSNQSLNFTNTGNLTTYVTNNWWGTTRAGVIRSKLKGLGFSAIPYRLFGPFNIQPGADTAYMPRITWATGYVVNNNDVVLKWQSTASADFTKYRVYRSTNSSLWSNLSPASFSTQISSVSVTNITNFNQPIGTQYYHITAMDDPAPPAGSSCTNESWYSRTIRVTVTLSNIVWNITKNTYHPTIMSAVSNAGNNNVLEVLYGGTYNERIVLSPVTTTATNLVLGTFDWWTNRVLGPVRLTSGGGTNIIVSNGYSLKLEGFIVTNNVQGAFFKNASGSVLNHNLWVSNDLIAAEFVLSDNIVVYSNVLRGNYQNILMTGTSNSMIRKNTVYDSISSAGATALKINTNNNRNISVYSNDFHDIQGQAVVLLNLQDSRIRGNRIYRNSLNGLYLRGNDEPARNNYLMNNMMYSNKITGLRLDGTNDHNYIIDNSLYGNTNGSRVDNSRSTVFSNNKLFGNSVCGFIFSGNCVSNSFSENSVYENSLLGIYLDGNNADSNKIRKNYIYDNMRYGIVIKTNCRYNEITDNYIISGSTNGILLYQNNDFTLIRNNNVATNYSGIVVYSAPGDECDGLNIRNNRIFSNSNVGLYLQFATNAAVISNNIDNGLYGIYLYGTRKIGMAGNRITTQLSNAAVLDNSYAASLVDCRLDGNNTGIRLVLTTNVYIAGNTFTNNGNAVLLTEWSRSNTFTNNNILNNNTGLYLFYAQDNLVLNNRFKYNLQGLQFENGSGMTFGNTVSFNRIVHNTNGILFHDNSMNYISANTVSSNLNGLVVTHPGGVVTVLHKNNLCFNTRFNITNMGTLTANTTLSNWFGTTIVSNIRKKIVTTSGPVFFLPYRLFGEFDIAPNADIDGPPVVTGLTAKVTNGNQVALNWNSSSGASRYFIYRTEETGYSNLSRSSVIGVTAATDFLDTTSGGYDNYYVTALDASSPYTNESWYSTNRSVLITGLVLASNTHSGLAWNNAWLKHAAQTNRELAGIRVDAYTFTNINLSRISLFLEYTNLAVDTNFTGLILYCDHGLTGTLDAADRAVATNSTPLSGWIMFSNLSGLNIPKNTSSNYLITFTHKYMTNSQGLKTLLSNSFSVKYIVAGSSVTNFALGNGYGRTKMVHEPVAYFVISHKTNYYTGEWGEVIVQAFATNDSIPYPLIDQYGGIISIGVSGTGASIDWTNRSGLGVLTTNANGTAQYNFSYADAGVVTLFIRDNTAETVNVSVEENGIYDLNTEGPVYFMPGNPYILSMNVVQNSYDTVSELNNLQIIFAQVLVPDSVASNITFYDSDNNPLAITLSYATNTNGGIIRTAVTVNPGLSQSEILKQYWIEINTNIRATNGFKLVDNPFMAQFAVPYYSLYTTLIDDTVGGQVTTPDNTGILVIDPAVLPDDAYVRFQTTSPSASAAISAANSKVENNRYLRIISGYNTYKEILAHNRNLTGISALLKNARIYISYPDTDNNGKVDNTDIDESKLRLYYLDETRTEWLLVEDSLVDTANNRVVGDIGHFSIYGLMGDYQAKTFEESFLTYPNPANVKDYTVKIKFYMEKTARMNIKIYTITGELVRNLVKDVVFQGGVLYEGSRAVVWDGKNDMGVNVVNSVYLLKVKGEYTDGSGTFSKTWKQGIMK